MDSDIYVEQFTNKNPLLTKKRNNNNNSGSNQVTQAAFEQQAQELFDVRTALRALEEKYALLEAQNLEEKIKNKQKVQELLNELETEQAKSR